jgi:hypothetical protein
MCVYSMMHGGQWCMFMWACFGMLCMGEGGGGAGGQEEGGHQRVNVLKRRVAGMAYLGTVSETARQENLCFFKLFGSTRSFLASFTRLPIPSLRL